MLQVGDRVPDATVYLGPKEPLTLAELVEDGPKLLVFYLFDWSST
jgi:peroxiredoxin